MPVLEAINDLYINELRLWMNFFQPSVKLVGKERIGARLIRRYDEPKTPLDRVLASPMIDQETKAALREQRATLDPFTLSKKIDQKLDQIRALAKQQPSPTARRHGYPNGQPKPHPVNAP